MIRKELNYRFVSIEELEPGFSCEKKLKTTGDWVPVTVAEKLTQLEQDHYLELVQEKRLRVSFYDYIEYPDEEEEVKLNWYQRKIKPYIDTVTQYGSKIDKIGKYIYSSLFSVAHGVLWWFCTIWLNMLEQHYPRNIDSNVMGIGTTQIQLSLTVLAVHLSSVFVASLVDWTQSGMQSYLYQNPYILKNRYDLRTDLTLAATDPAAKIRSQWHQKRFYTFYFVSIALHILYYMGNLIITKM